MAGTPIAIVTGAGGLLGGGLALALAQRGYAVLAVDRSLEAAQEVAGRAGGQAVVAHGADVSDEDAVAGYVSDALRRWGRVDAFANNAGIEGPAAAFAAFPTAAFRQVLEINVVGMFLGLKHVLPVMKAAGGGAVVNTASVAGLFGSPGVIAYGASKHAVIGLTRAAAVEHAGDGIRVNAICPGPVTGRMMASIEAAVGGDDPAAVHAAYLDRIPMRRYAEADEIVRTMVWLLTDAPTYLTGQAVTVDGALLVS